MSPRILALTVFSAVLLSGCATSTGKQTTMADMLHSLFSSGEKSVDTAVEDHIRWDLEQKRPEKALEHLRAARAAGYSRAALAAYYPDVINALIREADVSRLAGRPAHAGKLYRSALDNYPDSPATARKILLPPGSLHQNIEQCADVLMQQGLMHYRSGHLDDALHTWTKIGSFLPDHQPSLIAIETTRTQLQTLRQLGANRIN